MSDLLRVNDLKVEFTVHGGTINAVRGVSFRVRPGSTVAIVGESGSGKSVVSQCIMGILPRAGRITGGEILFDDPDSPGGPRDLVALDPIEVEFHVAERDSARVSQNQQVLVSVDPYPDELFGATVTMISPIIDPKTRTLRVLARLENPEGRLRPGLFARADLGVETRRGVTMVPEEAILQRADGSVVFRLRDGNHVQRVPVDVAATLVGGASAESWISQWAVVAGIASSAPPGQVGTSNAVLEGDDVGGMICESPVTKPAPGDETRTT